MPQHYTFVYFKQALRTQTVQILPPQKITNIAQVVFKNAILIDM